MEKFATYDVYDIRPVANKAAVITGDRYRITILTSRLVRLEYSENGKFIDNATRFAFCRDFPVPNYTVHDNGDSIRITTDYLNIFYNKQDFTYEGLRIIVNGDEKRYGGSREWCYSAKCATLGGTVRTLDFTNGEVMLEDGIISRVGYSVHDDSSTMCFDENGFCEPIFADGRKDLYFFGYMHDYNQCMKDYYALTGKIPLLPRFAYGNWWSRYHKYTDNEYLQLMDKFTEKGIPLSVSVIDMDWHITDIAPKYGGGWTGYTWNRTLFPNPDDFLRKLHDKKLHVSLNLHPKDGIREYEECYSAIRKALGKDSGECVEFDVSDAKFMNAYFKYVHNPLEDRGVDFWWIDWQQGGGTKKIGYDPLFMLNHYHYVDNARSKKRPLIFSRYSGPGSHRYPVGFSGDVFISWESLRFQPYFTATASNIGYCFWSHDIGGHMAGEYDEELEIRWYQFGVFSPIMRLHSADHKFIRKEPWAFSQSCEQIMTYYLKLRHRLVPYLVTCGKKCNNGQPLIRPLYYLYPESSDAYRYGNEYYLGDELLVCPITQKCDEHSQRARVNVWLPVGRMYDLQSGYMYDGGRELDMYRALAEMVVLAKCGSIIPMLPDGEDCSCSIPSHIELHVMLGDDGEHIMYEDNDMQKDELFFSETRFTMQRSNGATEVCIYPIGGTVFDDAQREREFDVVFYGAGVGSDVFMRRNGVSVEHLHGLFDEAKNTYTVTVHKVLCTDSISISINKTEPAKNNVEHRVFDFLAHAQISNDAKAQILDRLEETGYSYDMARGTIKRCVDSAAVEGALYELLTAQIK